MSKLFQKIELKNGEQLILTQAHEDDAEEVVHFLNKIGSETDFLTFGAHEFPLSVEEERATISECSAAGKKLMLVGKINNTIVGQLFLDRSDAPRLAHIGDLGVSVSQEHWGKSIGQNLVSHAILWAKSNGITKLQLLVHTDNTNAIALYKKLGFTIEGHITRAIKIDHHYFDNYMMGRCLP